MHLSTMTALSIACFGDSLTYGYPYGPTASWVKEAGEKLGIAAVNEGICGQTSADILARLYRALSCEKADIYVFCGGTNDILRDLALDEITGNVRAAREAVGTAGKLFVAASPLPLTPDSIACGWQSAAAAARHDTALCAYRTELAAFAGVNTVPFIDFYESFAAMQDHRLYYTDGVHPNRRGYEIMAATALNVLRDLVR